MTCDFVNRKKEKEALIALISSEIPVICLISGTRGVGKTGFTEHVLSQTNIAHIRVSVCEAADKIPPGYYLEEMAKATDSWANFNKKRELTLEYFFNHDLSNELKCRTASILVSSACQCIPFNGGNILNDFWQATTKSGKFNYQYLFKTSNEEILIILLSYIKYVFLKEKLGFVIENSQNIDFSSKKRLWNLIREKKFSFCILEYTVSQKQSPSELVYRIEKEIGEFQYLHLNKLKFNDYFLIAKVSLDYQDDLFKIYNESNGNIRQAQDAYFNNLSQETFMIYPKVHECNFTKLQLEKLPDLERLLLCAIVAHFSFVAEYELNNFLNSKLLKVIYFSTSTNNETAIQHLEKIKLIKKDSNNYSIYHDSITKEINSISEYNSVLEIAYKIWYKYYYSLIRECNYTTISEDQLHYRFFNFCLHYNPQKIYEFLPTIKKLALSTTTPEQVIYYLEHIENLYKKTTLNNQITEDLNYFLLNLYYDLGLFEKSNDILSRLDVSFMYKNIYTIALADRLENYAHCLELIDIELGKTQVKNNLRLSLILNLFKLISARSLNLYEICKNTYNHIEGNEAYKSYLEYGFFLRNSEIFLLLEDGIKNVKRAIKFFIDKENFREEGKAHLTLSLLYLWSGNLNLSEKELDIAEKLLIQEILERHMIFNNKATIKIYSGKIKNDIEQDLLNALLTVNSDRFSRISVIMNLIIYYHLSNDKDKKKKLYIEELLTHLKKENDKELLRVVYYNLSWIYLKDDQTLSNRYYDFSKCIHFDINHNLNRKCKDEDYEIYWDQRFNVTEIKECSYAFLLKYPFELCSLSYWHFPIPLQELIEIS